jgi:hypothetical protein
MIFELTIVNSNLAPSKKDSLFSHVEIGKIVISFQTKLLCYLVHWHFLIKYKDIYLFIICVYIIYTYI